MSLGRVFGSVVGLATITGTLFSGAALYMYAIDNDWFAGVPDLRVASKTIEVAPPLPTAKAPEIPQVGTVQLRPSVTANAEAGETDQTSCCQPHQVSRSATQTHDQHLRGR